MRTVVTVTFILGLVVLAYGVGAGLLGFGAGTQLIVVGIGIVIMLVCAVFKTIVDTRDAIIKKEATAAPSDPSPHT